jgi:hypothetical protein
VDRRLRTAILRATLLSLAVPQRLRPLTSTARREDLLVLKELADAGKLTPVISKTCPLSEFSRLAWRRSCAPACSPPSVRSPEFCSWCACTPGSICRGTATVAVAGSHCALSWTRRATANGLHRLVGCQRPHLQPTSGIDGQEDASGCRHTPRWASGLFIVAGRFRCGARVAYCGLLIGACQMSVWSGSVLGRSTELLWRGVAIRPQLSSPTQLGNPNGRSPGGIRA